MSHIVTIKTELRDHTADSATCRCLELAPPLNGTVQLFSGQVSGLIVRLSEWTYPVVINTATGQVHYDNYNGAWGDLAWLDHFRQVYAVEKASIEARKKGHQITEQTQADGSSKLTIRVGGGSLRSSRSPSMPRGRPASRRAASPKVSSVKTASLSSTL